MWEVFLKSHCQRVQSQVLNKTSGKYLLPDWLRFHSPGAIDMSLLSQPLEKPYSFPRVSTLEPLPHQPSRKDAWGSGVLLESSRREDSRRHGGLSGALQTCVSSVCLG